MVFLAKQRHEVFTRLLFAHTTLPLRTDQCALTRVLCQIFRKPSHAPHLSPLCMV